MTIGKKRRMNRIFQKDGKTVIVPMDHGVTIGPVKGLMDIQEITSKLEAGNADAILVHRGIAQSINVGNMGLIIHLTGSTVLGPEPLWKVIVCSIKEAMRLGADGISIHVNIGSAKEPEMLRDMGVVANKSNEFGLPLLAMMYPRGPHIKSEHDPELIKHATRIGFELGADIIKTNYTGSIESFKSVVKACSIPVIIAGGPKSENDRQFLQMISDSMEAGCAGVSIGRNIFQHKNPTLLVKAIKTIVHDEFSVEEATRILEEKE